MRLLIAIALLLPLALPAQADQFGSEFDPTPEDWQRTYQWIDDVARHFPTEEINTAMCVIYGESRGTASVTHPTSGARGLFQIMPNWADNAWLGSAGISYTDLLDGPTNVFVGYLVWKLQGWDAWAAYGRAYIKDCIAERGFVVPDSLLFYKEDTGTTRLYKTSPNASIQLQNDAALSLGWTTITNLDLDGDGRDEILFYRGTDGTFSYYRVKTDGTLGSLIKSGDGYTKGWSSIVPLDLDGDGSDEILFYREDGLFRYYDIRPDASIGSPMVGGDGYTKGWSSIVPIDLDGDTQDEILFYREDGLHVYYDIRRDGSLPGPIKRGDGYTKGWSSITAVDLDGDRQDEVLFYREDGLYRYYPIRPDASIGSPIAGGDGYTHNWTAITAIQGVRQP